MSLLRVFAAMALASILAAQPDPVPLTLVEKGIQSLHEFQSLEFTMIIAALNAEAHPVTGQVHFYSSHERFRLEMTGTTGGLIAVDDGQFLWTWVQASNQYQKAPQSLNGVRQIENLLVGLRASETSVRDLKLIRSETILVDDEPHDCWVLEGSMPIPPNVTDGRKGFETLWYDKTLGLLLRKDVVVDLPSRPGVLVARNLMHNLKTDGPLDNSRFIFLPPAGSKEQTPQARPVGSTGPVAQFSESASSGPQSSKSGRAPSLTILKLIAPVYPADAKNARVEGTVLLNALIEKDGTVSALKLISGHPLLVDAAMAAAKQWVYKPTMLNGEPISVQTTITVDFHLNTPAHATGQ